MEPIDDPATSGDCGGRAGAGGGEQINPPRPFRPRRLCTDAFSCVRFSQPPQASRGPGDAATRASAAMEPDGNNGSCVRVWGRRRGVRRGGLGIERDAGTGGSSRSSRWPPSRSAEHAGRGGGRSLCNAPRSGRADGAGASDSINTEAGKHPAWCHVTFKMPIDRFRTIRNLPEGKRGVVFQNLDGHHPGRARNGHGCSLECSSSSHTNMGV